MNLRLWRNAQDDARRIMGREDKPRGRTAHGEKYVGDWKANQDPLAWWCLTELLVAYAEGKKS